MRKPVSFHGIVAAGATRRGTHSLTSFRAEVSARLSLARLPESLCRAIAEIQIRTCEGILYQIGTGHFAWVHIFAGSGSGYCALVTTARRVRLQNSKECVLCANADDVVAALLSEIRRLRRLGAV
jgi:hypothetical protein